MTEATQNTTEQTTEAAKPKLTRLEKLTKQYADLYAKKGTLVLRVSMPKGPQAVESVKAIARKALARL